MTYSSGAHMNRQNVLRRNQNIANYRADQKVLGPISNTVMLIVLACFLGLLYLTQVTKTNAYGYQINDLQEQKISLRDQHAELEVASARLQALERVKTSQVTSQLVSVAPTATIR